MVTICIFLFIKFDILVMSVEIAFNGFIVSNISIPHFLYNWLGMNQRSYQIWKLIKYEDNTKVWEEAI